MVVDERESKAGTEKKVQSGYGYKREVMIPLSLKVDQIEANKSNTGDNLCQKYVINQKGNTKELF